MTNKQKIQNQLNSAIYQLKNKSTKSTFIERWFLLDEATKKFEKYSEPLILGKGLEYILERVSTPIDQCDILVGRYIDRVPTESEETALQEIWASELWRKNPIVELNVGHRCFDWETLVKIGIVGYIERTQEKIDQINLISIMVCFVCIKPSVDILKGIRLKRKGWVRVILPKLVKISRFRPLVLLRKQFNFFYLCIPCIRRMLEI